MNDNSDSARAEFIERRRSFIGGTDAAAILGLSPWKSAFSVWLDKTGQSEPQEMNPAMEWGIRLEEVIAGKWIESRIGLEYHEYRLTHPLYPFIGGTPDRMAFCDGYAYGLEVKTARSSEKWGATSEDIPEAYWMQCQWYAGLALDNRIGIDNEWHLAVLIGGSDYREYVIKFDRDTYEAAVERCVRFWREHVETGIAPEMDGSDAAREYITRTKPVIENIFRVATDSESDMIEQYANLIEEMQANEVMLGVIGNRLREIIGTDKGVITTKHKLAWVRSKESTRTEWKAVAEAMNPTPEIISKFSKQTAGREYLKLQTV